ncbi:MAG TPA: ABC transporter ATP-binding protein [Propionibacteriaceae bacterium]|nr:ABC transporter ATP-binding protein [Propionibacteriaceae bacterium]
MHSPVVERSTTGRSGDHPASPTPPSAPRAAGWDDLWRPATLAPKPSTRRGVTSLWRLRNYARPKAGTWLFMLLSTMISTGMSVAVPLVTQRLIDGPITSRDRQGLLLLGALAMLLGVSEAFFWFVRRWLAGPTGLGVETGIRTEMYAKLQRLPLAFHGGWESGQLLSRIMSDLSTIRRFISFGLLFMMVTVVQIAVVVGLLIHLYWPLGLVVLLSVVPISWLSLVNDRRYTRLSRRIQDLTGDVASAVEESAHAHRVVKAFGRSEHMFSRFDENARALFDVQIARVKVISSFWTFLEAIPTATMIVVLGIGALAASQHRLTLGTLVAFITLVLSLVWPIASMGFLLSMTQDSMTAADRICEVFDAAETLVDGPRTLDHPSGRLAFHGVGFRFPDGDEDVLHDVTLEIEPGETIALVGGTGSGKTTLTSLVPRLADVTAGVITIDGVDIRELELTNLRSIVATAFEDPTLFSMSARENLTLGRPDASDDDVRQAIEVAQAGFVYGLPWGLDTRIGEQGMSLSGGQRQRLALARAVITRPRVLVLDDTLSALDIHTEALVEEALKRVLVGVTGIVVAHRASTVLLADRVALLEGGTITHVGTHHELLATVPAYRNLMSAAAEQPGGRPPAAASGPEEARRDQDELEGIVAGLVDLGAETRRDRQEEHWHD